MYVCMYVCMYVLLSYVYYYSTGLRRSGSPWLPLIAGVAAGHGADEAHAEAAPQPV